MKAHHDLVVLEVVEDNVPAAEPHRHHVQSGGLLDTLYSGTPSWGINSNRMNYICYNCRKEIFTVPYIKA